MRKALKGKVAVVAGATRGAGRGIAVALGEMGATVYCTGRSVRDKPATKGRTETIQETAERVSASGGAGIAVRVDHEVEAEVKRLFARVARDEGRLDVLVNDVWGGDALTQWGQKFWELDFAKGKRMVEQAVLTHVLTSRHGAPLLVRKKRGLIVEITDGDGWFYRGNHFYDLVKTSVIRLAFGMAQELREHGVAAVAVSPGFLRSEAMLDHFGVTEATWREAGKKDPNFLESETPLFVGRAVAHLAADPKVLEKSGRVFGSWDLCDEYGFADADGRKPHWGRFFRAKYGDIFPRADEGFYRYGGDYEAAHKAFGL